MTQLKHLSIATLLLVGGCVQGEEVSSDGGDPSPDALAVGAPDHPGAQHEGCSATGACREGLTCIARVGPLDRRVATCEIPCAQGCPAGQRCVYLVEGPGEVCWQAEGGDRRVGCEELPGQGEPCPAGDCASGLTCVSFYGVAGPAGGLFTSCEIPCGDAVECPGGQRCVTIADGPGVVCRPIEPASSGGADLVR